jgi:hypothetical protein
MVVRDFTKVAQDRAMVAGDPAKVAHDRAMVARDSRQQRRDRREIAAGCGKAARSSPEAERDSASFVAYLALPSPEHSDLGAKFRA